MRIAALTNVADDSRTMLLRRAYSTVAVTTARSHQCCVGQVGAVIRLFSANLLNALGEFTNSVEIAPCFFRNAFPACGVGMLLS